MLLCLHFVSLNLHREIDAELLSQLVTSVGFYSHPLYPVWAFANCGVDGLTTLLSPLHGTHYRQRQHGMLALLLFPLARGHGCSEWMWFHLVCPGHGPRHCSWLEIENCLGMFVSWLTVVEVREFRVQATCPHCLAVRVLWESEIMSEREKKDNDKSVERINNGERLSKRKC